MGDVGVVGVAFVERPGQRNPADIHGWPEYLAGWGLTTAGETEIRVIAIGHAHGIGLSRAGLEGL